MSSVWQQRVYLKRVTSRESIQCDLSTNSITSLPERLDCLRNLLLLVDKATNICIMSQRTR